MKKPYAYVVNDRARFGSANPQTYHAYTREEAAQLHAERFSLGKKVIEVSLRDDYRFSIFGPVFESRVLAAAPPGGKPDKYPHAFTTTNQ